MYLYKFASYLFVSTQDYILSATSYISNQNHTNCHYNLNKNNYSRGYATFFDSNNLNWTIAKRYNSDSLHINHSSPLPSCPFCRPHYPGNHSHDWVTWFPGYCGRQKELFPKFGAFMCPCLVYFAASCNTKVLRSPRPFVQISQAWAHLSSTYICNQ